MEPPAAAAENGAAAVANGGAADRHGGHGHSHGAGHAFATQAIHGGQRPCPTTGAVFPAIYTSSTFAQTSPGVHQGFEYSRSHNPTRFAFERCVAALEGTGLSEADDTTCGAFAFASGLAAAATCFDLLDAGATVVCMDDVYGGTYRLLNGVRARTSGFTVVRADLSDPAAAAAAITGAGAGGAPAMVWLETPTNPTLKLCDVAAVAALCKEAGALCVVDNTFATPALTRPLELGADVVLSSTTKYIAGHSDTVGGVLATRSAALAARLRYLQNAVGAVMSPWDAYLALRGAKTLHVRMARHCANAAELARRLEAAGAVERVVYPGLPSHPQHALAARQMRLPSAGPRPRAGGAAPEDEPAFGGMISLHLKGGLAEGRAFLEALRLFTLAESLGGVESLAEHPAIMTHGSVPAEERAALGITDGFVRLSVGIEHVEDLWADLEGALQAAAAASAKAKAAGRGRAAAAPLATAVL